MNADTTPDGALLELLQRDPIAEMEKELGRGHHSEFTKPEQFACLGHAMALNQKKAAALKAAGDTGFSNNLDDYLRIVSEEGFDVVLREPFVCQGRSEVLYILWHPDGILLKFDTYGGDHVNSGNFYYNWKPKNPDVWFGPGNVERITSSGSWKWLDNPADRVWAGCDSRRVGQRTGDGVIMNEVRR